MTPPTPEQFAKLPKGVQRYIVALQEDNKKLADKNEWLENANRLEVDGSNVVIAQGFDRKTGIDSSCDVEFFFSNDPTKRWRSSISVRLNGDKDKLIIMGDDSINVSPQASNVVHVSLVP